MNALIDLVQSIVDIPGKLADAAWLWAAGKVMPTGVIDPADNWEDEVVA